MDCMRNFFFCLGNLLLAAFTCFPMFVQADTLAAKGLAEAFLGNHYNVSTSNGQGRPSKPRLFSATADPAVATPDPEPIFRWAESAFKTFFAPSGQPTQILFGYTLRYYPGTNTYLGIAQGRVYVYGPLSKFTLLDVGSLTDLLSLAGASGFTALPFTFGAPQVLTVGTAAPVSDSVSGLGFSLPAGSSTAQVTVEPVVSSGGVTGSRRFAIVPDQAVNIGFAVDYSSGEEVEVRIWGPKNGIGNYPAGRYAWRLLSASNDDGRKRAYVLPTASLFQTAAGAFAAGREDGDRKLVVAFAKLTAERAARRAAGRAQVQGILDGMLNQLPDTAKTTVRANQALFPAEISMGYADQGDCKDEDGSSYTPYSQTYGGLIGLKTGYLEFCGLGDISVAYHEIGHYLHHMLVGDTRFKAISGQSRNYGVEHTIGMRFDRNSLLEDVAYFFEMYGGGGKDSVFSEAGGLGAPFSSANAEYRAQPRNQRDYPALEGFAATLLNYLHAGVKAGETPPKSRNVLLPYGLNGVDALAARVPVPVVGASYPVLADRIIARGAGSMSELRQHILDYLGGDQAKLAVIAERVGWSYAATGTLVDKTGKAVFDARVVPICTVDSVIYETESTTTSLSGTFKLPRVFPGSACKLKAFLSDGQVQELSVAVDWDRPTSDTIDLGIMSLQDAGLKILDTLNIALNLQAAVTPSCTVAGFSGLNANSYTLVHNSPTSSSYMFSYGDGKFDINNNRLLCNGKFVGASISMSCFNASFKFDVTLPVNVGSKTASITNGSYTAYVNGKVLDGTCKVGVSGSVTATGTAH